MFSILCTILATMMLSSANTFNLDKAKILSSGKLQYHYHLGIDSTSLYNPTSVFEKAPLLCIKPNPVVRKHKYIFLEECRTRSACTYTQSDHALHSSQLNPIRIPDMCRLIIVFIISSQANPMPFKQSKSACVLVIVAALYFYSVLKSVYGGSHTVCWVKAL